jgi:hypothetical protein
LVSALGFWDYDQPLRVVFESALPLDKSDSIGKVFLGLRKTARNRCTLANV